MLLNTVFQYCKGIFLLIKRHQYAFQWCCDEMGTGQRQYLRYWQPFCFWKMITLLYDLVMFLVSIKCSPEWWEKPEMITHLNLCHHHKTQQLTCQSHRIEDHFVNPRNAIDNDLDSDNQQGKINLSMVNSHNKVVSGIFYSRHIILKLQNNLWLDHHSYRCNFATVPNHSYGHSLISTASGQLAWQFQFWLWVSYGKNTVVYNGGFDFQYVYACQIFFESVVHTENLCWLQLPSWWVIELLQ